MRRSNQQIKFTLLRENRELRKRDLNYYKKLMAIQPWSEWLTVVVHGGYREGKWSRANFSAKRVEQRDLHARAMTCGSGSKGLWMVIEVWVARRSSEGVGICEKTWNNNIIYSPRIGRGWCNFGELQMEAKGVEGRLPILMDLLNRPEGNLCTNFKKLSNINF